MHKQVEKHLEWLRKNWESSVHAGFNSSRCSTDKFWYEQYLKEVEKNGDKNLLFYIKWKGRIYPCAKKHVRDDTFRGAFDGRVVYHDKYGEIYFDIYEDEVISREFVERK